MGYVELEKRITNLLYERVTLAIDILQLDNPPSINLNCNDCNFFNSQSKLSN